jgi:hypothetical protein
VRVAVDVSSPAPVACLRKRGATSHGPWRLEARGARADQRGLGDVAVPCATSVSSRCIVRPAPLPSKSLSMRVIYEGTRK